MSACDPKRSTESGAAAALSTPSQATRGTVLARVSKLIAEQLSVPVSTVTSEKTLIADLGADELDIVEIWMTMEDEFSLSIEEESIDRMKTVGDVATYIEQKTKP